MHKIRLFACVAAGTIALPHAILLLQTVNLPRNERRIAHKFESLAAVPPRVPALCGGEPFGCFDIVATCWTLYAEAVAAILRKRG